MHITNVISKSLHLLERLLLAGFLQLHLVRDTLRGSSRLLFQRALLLTTGADVSGRFFVEEGELGKGGKGIVLLVRHVLDGVSLGHFACKRVPVGVYRHGILLFKGLD